ncbi:30S ribosomal protein S16 [Candidatus Fermentibacterales bacterium]|nr:30S ribosomal protein S16 [Candidatus Fermentibacterales bacterium]
MAVSIRLRRLGSSRQAFYRIVAADSRTARDGRFLEALGYYDPLKKPMEVKVDESRVFYWMSNGARVTDTVRSILRKTGTWAKWARLRTGEQVEPEVVSMHGAKRTTGIPEGGSSAGTDAES